MFIRIFVTTSGVLIGELIARSIDHRMGRKGRRRRGMER